ncbi:DUF2089 domain-containing protein [soil metagenome]
MRKIVEKCPSCGGDLEVTRLNCTNCETVITGRYKPCRFCKLSPESTNFLEVFVKNRGNVKEMERELGISYWVVRGKLNDLIKDLGFEPAPADEVPNELDEAALKAQRQEILHQIDRGELGASEAAKLLAQLK